MIKRSLSKSTELVLSHTTVREARGWKEQGNEAEKKKNKMRRIKREVDTN